VQKRLRLPESCDINPLEGDGDSTAQFTGFPGNLGNRGEVILDEGDWNGMTTKKKKKKKKK